MQVRGLIGRAALCGGVLGIVVLAAGTADAFPSMAPGVGLAGSAGAPAVYRDAGAPARLILVQANNGRRLGNALGRLRHRVRVAIQDSICHPPGLRPGPPDGPPENRPPNFPRPGPPPFVPPPFCPSPN